MPSSTELRLGLLSPERSAALTISNVCAQKNRKVGSALVLKKLIKEKGQVNMNRSGLLFDSSQKDKKGKG